MDILDEIGEFEEVQKSRRGDHQPLIDLLRSGEHLPTAVRNYMADELEKPSKKRFTRQSQKDPEIKHRDCKLLELVAMAKLTIARKIIEGALRSGQTPAPPLNGYRWSAIEHVKWRHVSDRAALGRLAEAGHEIEADDLVNAINRRKRDEGDWEYLKQRPLLTFRA